MPFLREKAEPLLQVKETWGVTVLCRTLVERSVNPAVLAKHLGRCNAAKKAAIASDFQTIGINEASDSVEEVSAKSLAEFTDAEIRETVMFLQTVSEAHGIEIERTTKSLIHPFMQEVLDDSRHWAVNGISSSTGPTEAKKTKMDDTRGSGRHVFQNGCLLHLLTEGSLLSDKFDFVELGAGRGGLSHWIASTLLAERGLEPGKQLPNKFFLVEMMKQRHNFDSRRSIGANYIRLVTDLAHLDLKKVTSIDGLRDLVFVAKHLCGDATDFALRSLRTMDSAKTKAAGLMIATCCHHRCTWKQTVGRPWLESELRLNARQFFLLSRLSTWATCGLKDPDHTVPDAPSSVCWSKAERERIGFMCKRIIDWGRLQFIKNELSLGSAPALRPYISVEYTPENVCIFSKNTD